ncbi:methyltransferase LaeA [Xylariaceae sp. FL0255]|nr:methyltransferase LaeA [Xylariaceae sp. FL0255]
MNHLHVNGFVHGSSTPSYTSTITLDQREPPHREVLHRREQQAEQRREGQMHNTYVQRWGRWYPTIGQERYMLPADDGECDRLDIFHKFFSVARADEPSPFPGLCSHPLPPDCPKILDLGCGTGIWSIDIADRLVAQGPYYVEGWDLSYNQPEKIPKNVFFRQQDMEDPWINVEPDSFDLIHMRMLNGSIRDWDRLYANVFRHLKPGSGLLEQAEIDWQPKSNVDPSIIRDTALMEWSDKLHQGFERAGMRLDTAADTKARLARAGFVDIEYREKRIYLNPWPADETEKDIARWFNLGLTQGLEALTLKSLIYWLHLPEQEVRELIEKVKVDICRRQWQTFCTMHIWVARRPPHPTRRA